MRIIIVGMGWLGQQLAMTLHRAGQQIYATRRSTAALAALPASVNTLVLELGLGRPTDPALLPLFADAIVICAIAPGKQSQAGQYEKACSELSALIQRAKSRGVIHFSSSGIYTGLEHNVDETARLQPDTPRVQTLVAAEQALMQTQCCITLRLAGLMGPGRHPGRFAGGKTLPNPHGSVNMVHAADVIAAVAVLLQQTDYSNAIYNLSCPAVVTRQVFYAEAARQAGTVIEFSAQPEQSRWVNPQKFIRQFGFNYRYVSACDALAHCD
ncbi:MAG: hypothetical protein R3241_06490 [Rheinheimera sp.]|nr:hypothetical protein [Rheinheimera sp.]